MFYSYSTAHLVIKGRILCPLDMDIDTLEYRIATWPCRKCRVVERRGGREGVEEQKKNLLAALEQTRSNGFAAHTACRRGFFFTLVKTLLPLCYTHLCAFSSSSPTSSSSSTSQRTITSIAVVASMPPFKLPSFQSLFNSYRVRFVLRFAAPHRRSVFEV